jgi:hypothetical protein
MFITHLLRKAVLMPVLIRMKITGFLTMTAIWKTVAYVRKSVIHVFDIMMIITGILHVTEAGAGIHGTILTIPGDGIITGA